MRLALHACANVVLCEQAGRLTSSVGDGISRIPCGLGAFPEMPDEAVALAIDTLERVLREDGASASAKVAASVAILDRAGHNPKANNEEGGEVIYRIIGGLPDPEH